MSAHPPARPPARPPAHPPTHLEVHVPQLPKVGPHHLVRVAENDLQGGSRGVERVVSCGGWRGSKCLTTLLASVQKALRIPPCPALPCPALPTKAGIQPPSRPPF